MDSERWLVLFRILRQVTRGRKRCDVTHPDFVIVAVFLWAVVNDRSILWATQSKHWPTGLRHFKLPSQSCMSRRLRCDRVIKLFDEIADCLRQCDEPVDIKYIDAKPLPVSRHSADSEATFGRGAGGLNRGYKLYAIWTPEQVLPDVWRVYPINRHESKVGRELVADLPLGAGWLLGDSAYDTSPFYEAAGQRGYQVLANRHYKNAKGVGHHRHSEFRLRGLDLIQQEAYQEMLKKRRGIETCFGNLTGFGGGLITLPPWARRLHRVRLWVHGKLLVNAARIIINRKRKAMCA